MARQKNKSPSKVDYELLGRSIESIVVSGHYDRSRYYKMAFFRGVFMGLGSVIGATIIIALILWVLSLLEAIPFIGPIAESFQETIETPPDDL